MKDITIDLPIALLVLAVLASNVGWYTVYKQATHEHEKQIVAMRAQVDNEKMIVELARVCGNRPWSTWHIGLVPQINCKLTETPIVFASPKAARKWKAAMGGR